MSAYYNEWEPYPAQWLRNLIKANLIAPGDVDERSIKDVHADDIRGYTQCHFFAGIGGWSHALRLAGWEDSRPVWTGSCPCQPYSSAGQGKGQSDERHLWPDWYRLISECKPTEVFGEQVSRAIAYGWLDEVKHDLESKNYAFGAALLPACSVQAPHERERIFFVAHTEDIDDRGRAGTICEKNGGSMRNNLPKSSSTSEIPEAMAYGDGTRLSLGNGFGNGEGSEPSPARRESIRVRSEAFRQQWQIEPPFPIVADGLQPFRVEQICAYGNAIVPQVAQAFIEAFMEVRP